MDKVTLILKHERILSIIYRAFGRNKIDIDGKGNTIFWGNSFIKRCRIRVVGENNRIIFSSNLSRISDCSITIYGSNCSIFIGDKCNLNYLHLYIEDNNGQIEIGKHLTVTGKCHIDVIEGKKVTIGNECLFATDISFRVGDSHSILDKIKGNRINPSQDITIGQHVWIGYGVKILKGTYIPNDSIVATGAIVTNKKFPANCIIGGIPAKVIKEGVTWDAHRLPIE